MLEIGRIGSTSDTIQQKFIQCEGHRKMSTLLQVLRGGLGVSLQFFLLE